MGCSRTLEVHRYHDGELSVAERSALDAHLDGCEACSALLGDLRGLSALLTGAARAEAPGDLVIEIRRTAEQARDRSIIRIAGWLTATAAAVLVGALVTWPAGSKEPTSSPDAWEIMAVRPAGSVRGDNSSDPILLAQWMADEFTSVGNGETR